MSERGQLPLSSGPGDYESSRSSSTDSRDGLLSSDVEKRGKAHKPRRRSIFGGRALWRVRGRMHRFTLLLVLTAAVVTSLVLSVSMLGMKMQTKKILKKHGSGPRPWQAFPL